MTMAMPSIAWPVWFRRRLVDGHDVLVADRHRPMSCSWSGSGTGWSLAGSPHPGRLRQDHLAQHGAGPQPEARQQLPIGPLRHGLDAASGRSRRCRRRCRRVRPRVSATYSGLTGGAPPVKLKPPLIGISRPNGAPQGGPDQHGGTRPTGPGPPARSCGRTPVASCFFLATPDQAMVPISPTQEGSQSPAMRRLPVEQRYLDAAGWRSRRRAVGSARRAHRSRR